MKKYYKYFPWIPVIGFVLMLYVGLFTNDMTSLELTTDKPIKYYTTLAIQSIAFVILIFSNLII